MPNSIIIKAALDRALQEIVAAIQNKDKLVAMVLLSDTHGDLTPDSVQSIAGMEFNSVISKVLTHVYRTGELVITVIGPEKPIGDIVGFGLNTIIVGPVRVHDQTVAVIFLQQPIFVQRPPNVGIFDQATQDKIRAIIEAVQRELAALTYDET